LLPGRGLPGRLLLPGGLPGPLLTACHVWCGPGLLWWPLLPGRRCRWANRRGPRWPLLPHLRGGGSLGGLLAAGHLAAQGVDAL